MTSFMDDPLLKLAFLIQIWWRALLKSVYEPTEATSSFNIEVSLAIYRGYVPFKSLTSNTKTRHELGWKFFRGFF